MLSCVAVLGSSAGVHSPVKSSYCITANSCLNISSNNTQLFLMTYFYAQLQDTSGEDGLPLPAALQQAIWVDLVQQTQEQLVDAYSHIRKVCTLMVKLP